MKKIINYLKAFVSNNFGEGKNLPHEYEPHYLFGLWIWSDSAPEFEEEIEE